MEDAREERGEGAVAEAAGSHNWRWLAGEGRRRRDRDWRLAFKIQEREVPQPLLTSLSLRNTRFWNHNIVFRAGEGR